MTNSSLKLYLVTLRGFGGFTTGVDYKRSYVVAPDAETAYLMVKTDLDKQDYGYASDRTLESVQLLAETGEFNTTGTQLYLPPTDSQPIDPFYTHEPKTS